ncbi:MAG TPA: hypothetical protein VKT80_01860 [Chloroflexota bacterium]|nr:hypothetical protein [Chloroflexota bacterium]
MTLKLPDDTKHARTVHMFSGPIQRLQLRHAPSEWVIHSEGKGADLAESVDAR